MKKRNMQLLLISVVTLFLIAAGTLAFAQSGMPSRQNAGDREYNRPYRFQDMNLTDEQLEKLEREHKAFFTATRPFHQNLRAKRLELAAELAKKSPDVRRAATLQKEISDLDAVLNQKQLEHTLVIQKICPEASGNCCGYYAGEGYGRGGRQTGPGGGPCGYGRWMGGGGHHSRGFGFHHW